MPPAVTIFVQVAVEAWAILLAVAVSLTLTSVFAAWAGHLALRRVLARSFLVGIGTLVVGYLAGLVPF